MLLAFIAYLMIYCKNAFAYGGVLVAIQQKTVTVCYAPETLAYDLRTKVRFICIFWIKTNE